MSLPDLLFQQPGLRFDIPALRQQLAFSFASGGSGQALDELFSRGARTDPAFNEQCFRPDLYVDDLVRLLGRWQRATGPNHRSNHLRLTRILTTASTNKDTIELRHGVLRELLARVDLRAKVTELWGTLAEFKELLESAELGKRSHGVARRVTILRKLVSAADQLGTFSDSNSHLRVLAEFGEMLGASSAFQSLRSLLDFESQRAVVDLRLSLAYDGSIRQLELVAAREPQAKSLFGATVARWFVWIFSALRGYRLPEEEILGRSIQTVFDGVETDVLWFLQLQLDLEFYLAALAFSDQAKTHGLAVCLPEMSESEQALEIQQLFNPFLLEEPKAPVPADLHLPRRSIALLTGPNSGGKTRLLQALGLSQMLAQCGFFVPAGSAKLPLLSGLFVSLVHGQASDEHEGRLGSELTRIRRMFELLDFNSLVLLDELCSGTNPSEGEEIFELVVSLLVELTPVAVITTHFLEFAQRLEREGRLTLRFLQVDLDAHSVPTYQFVPGVATTSLARKTAERLGVTREALQQLINRKAR
ncbi:MAG: DNA mismatch repair protein [Polyangiaceae bacterium]|nr:DNA mismatch repair protein [Polyangiaceae bacterium]